MNEPNFTLSFSVDQSPSRVFAAINEVDQWWSGRITGETKKLGGEFTYRDAKIHTAKQRITESSRTKKWCGPWTSPI